MLSLTLRPYALGPACPADSGCLAVTGSRFSSLLGLPLSLWGLGYYLAYLPLLRRPPLARLWAAVGALVSLVLTGLQVFSIGAICPFCLLSAGCCWSLWLRREEFTELRKPPWAALPLLALLALPWGETRRPLPPFQGGHRLGPEQAPTRLVILSDLRCPHCAATFAGLDAFQQAHPGQASLTSVLFPLPGADSLEAARAAEAAARQDRYWEFVRQAYRHVCDPLTCGDWARAAGLNLERFAADMNAPALRDTVLAGRRQFLGKIPAVPAVFLNEQQQPVRLDWLPPRSETVAP